MKPRELAAYLFLALTWGFSFLVLLRVVEAFGWVGAVTFRCLIAGTTLLAGAALLGRKLEFPNGWKPLAIVGATTVAGQLVGLSFATPLIGTAMAAILVATIPLFSMILSRLWGLEKLSKSGIIGLIMGFAGIVVLVGFPAVPITGAFILGCVCSIFSALCAAFGSVYASRHLRETGSWAVTVGAFLFGGVMTLPLLVAVPVPTPPGLLDYAYLAVLACVMSATTYVLYFRLVASIGATRAISVEFAVTVVAVLIGALVLHEPLSLAQIAGAVIIVAGCALVLGLVPGRMGPTRGA